MAINELVQTETFIWHDQDIICQMIVGIFPKNIVILRQNFPITIHLITQQT